MSVLAWWPSEVCLNISAAVPHLVIPPCSSEIALACLESSSSPPPLLSGEFLGKLSACLEGTGTAEALDPVEDFSFHRQTHTGEEKHHTYTAEVGEGQ